MWECFLSVKNYVSKSALGMIFLLSKVLPKLVKKLKSEGLQPLLWVYKGLVVVVKRGCGVIRGLIFLICDIK